MGVLLSLVNFDKLIKESTVQPIIVNDLSTSTEEDKRLIDKLISTKYDNDILSNEPTCECGELRSGFNLGVVCGNCNTPVREIFDQQLKPLVWMRSPIGVNKLINPVVWNMLTIKFTKSGGFSFIEWICNTDYQPAVSKPVEIDLLLSWGLKRGYNNFVDNFETVIEMLYSLKIFKKKDAKDENLLLLLSEQRNSVFSNYIPLPNKSLLIVEENIGETYVDPIIVGAIDAIRTISSIDYVIKDDKSGVTEVLNNYTVRQKENRTCKTIAKLADFYYSFYHEVLAPKSGWFRKHNFGTRNHFSARAVISSNTKQHKYDELHISWGVACTMLKTHIMSKLLKRDYSPNEANDYIQFCTSTYDKLMDDIFQELINEAKEANGKGICCFFVRNPSLARASVQQFYISLVKIDINDPTITLPIISVVGFNADFDGDQMSLVLANDNVTSRELDNLAPHKSMYSVNKPRTLTDNARIPKPVASTISNWLHSAEPPSNDPEKVKFMTDLAEPTSA